MIPDPVVHIAELAESIATASDPIVTFRATELAAKRLTGHKLFTLLVVVPGADEVERVYSSNPKAYPVTGRKPMSRTPWGDHVIGARKPWLGRDMDAIRWAFFDHELIASLGCGSCINVPVSAMGEMIGTMNVLDAERAYDERHVALLQAIAPVLAVPFLQVLGRLPAAA